MPRAFAIWGCAGHAKVLLSLIEAQGGQVLAFFDNREMPPTFLGTPAYVGERGFNQWLESVKEPSSISGLVAIGGHRGADRLKIQSMFRAGGLTLEPVIHTSAFVCSTAAIGEGSQVLAQAVVAAECRIGDTCIINHKASVDHECTLGDGVHLAPGATLCGCVTVGDDVLVGAGSVVLPRLKIGSHSIIGAGAVVTRDVPERSVIVGNPGRPRF